MRAGSGCRRKIQKLGQGNLQSLGQTQKDIQRRRSLGRLNAVDCLLGNVGHIGKFLLAPAPLFPQAPQVTSECRCAGWFFHAGKLPPSFRLPVDLYVHFSENICRFTRAIKLPARLRFPKRYMMSPFHSCFLLPIALFTGSFLHELPTFDLVPSSTQQSRPQPRPQPRNFGARADSLNGISGHHFGDPLSSFPELVAKGYRDLEGYDYYTVRPGQEKGWFGKNAEHVQTVYRFYQDKFASFDATSYGNDRLLLTEQARYMFGTGQPQSPKDLAYGQTATRWEGKQVRVRLINDGPNSTMLVVLSKVAAAQKAADALAQQKQAAAAQAAKMRADNAPPKL